MNNEIINEISENLNIKKEGIEAVLKLLEEGNTVPFIARYRKEATGALDEEQIRSINEYYDCLLYTSKPRYIIIIIGTESVFNTFSSFSFNIL